MEFDNSVTFPVVIVLTFALNTYKTLGSYETG